MDAVRTLQDVKSYYGEVLSSKSDLQTSACCTDEAYPPEVKEVLAMIEDEIHERFYGCGSPIPQSLAGCTVLDLGCGTGRDVFVASKLVGEQGRVIGVDMTEQQLEVARRNEARQMERFGFANSNVEFHQGFIEDLSALGIADNSVDVVISNCVINLSPDKQRVFSEIFRVLKPGGELYFSDVFSNRRIPEPLQSDPVLRGECLSGALYFEDFRRMLFSLGCPDYRMMSNRRLDINNPEIQTKVGNIGFFSSTVRAFKIAELEDRCEDFGHVATYQGSIAEAPLAFTLDDHHLFQVGKPELVCGNTALMLAETRFGAHFDVKGDFSQHFGLFDCGDAPESSAANSNGASANGACC